MKTIDTVGHTPGPWRLYSSCSSAWIGRTGSGEIVCEAPDFGNFPATLPNWDANARLIAAAPELLTALREMLRDYEPTDPADAGDAVILARAALAKATGNQP